MSSEDTLLKYRTNKVKLTLPEFWPREGAPPEVVTALEKKRSELSIPSKRLARDIEDKKKVSEDNDKVAKDREAAGIQGRDFAYAEGHEKRQDSKKGVQGAELASTRLH